MEAEVWPKDYIALWYNSLSYWPVDTKRTAIVGKIFGMRFINIYENLSNKFLYANHKVQGSSNKET